MHSVMIVDDEPMILQGLKDIIEWEEYGLEVAALAVNGLKARDILTKSKIDILLTDIRMPEMNGLDLIHYIRMNNLNIKIIILSGYDDFVYVKDAIRLGVENYLLKPVNKDELSLTLLNVTDKIENENNREINEVKSRDIFKQNLLYRWVSNNISIHEFQERASLIGICLDYAEYQVVTLNILDDMRVRKYNMFGADMVRICNAARTPQVSPMIFCDLDDNIIMLFSGVGLLDKKNDIIAYLHKCISLINAQWPINLFSTIGSVEKNYCNVSRSYDSAKELQEYSLIYEPNSVLNFTDIQKSESGNDAIVRFNYDKLYEHLVNQRKDHAVNMIEEYYSHVLSMEGITPKIVQNISVEILYNLSGLYKKVVRSYDMPHDLGILFSDIMKFKTHHELVDWISLIVNKMLDCLVACEEKQNPLIKHIIQHVNMHYQEPLSLKTISASQNVNTSYLGQLFKNETGELFTNYLNGVRIQKAQEMLTKTNMKVYDIAYKTGYVNQSLFFRTFKKYTGVSPEEYRERNIRA